MKKKGFTLVELLAVIVILAVVAIIAVPIILNVIESAKKGAIKDSAYGIIESANVYVASNLKEGLKTNIKFTCEKNKCISSDNQVINFKGKVEQGTLIIDTKGNALVCVDDGEYYALKNVDDKDVSNGDGTCGVYEEENGEFAVINATSERIEALEKELNAYKNFYDNNIAKIYTYTGQYQEFKAPVNGTYKIELWGASAAGTALGGYTKGDIHLEKDQILYVYVGETTKNCTACGSWNGGGKAGGSGSSYTGGGATDVRVVPTSSSDVWQEDESLRSRIMVAAGGGGSENSQGGAGGGLNGYIGNTGGTATQISGFAFGYGCAYSGDGSGGGGGWYGGYCPSNDKYGGGGGSSYISGHNGCIGVDKDGVKNSSTATKVEDSYSHSGFIFTNTVIIDGAGYSWGTSKAATADGMPAPSSSQIITGNVGNGYAKITLLIID